MDYYGDDRPGRGRWLWAIPVLLVVLAVPAVILLVEGQGDGGATATDGREPLDSTITSSPPTGDGEVDQAGIEATNTCPPLEDSPTELPVIAPDAEWRTKGPITYPVSVGTTNGSSVNGPARIRFPGTDTCYARTPIGAAFAAASASAEILVSGSAVDYLRTRVIGEGRDELIADISQLAPDDFSFGDINFRIIAFKIVDFTPERALVEVVTQGRNSTGVTSTKAGLRELVWVANDWKVVLDSEAAASTGSREVADPEDEGFVVWPWS